MFKKQSKTKGVKIQALLDGKDSNIKSINSSETLYAASRVMTELKIGVLIVFNEDKKFAGVISEREIVGAMGRFGGEAASVPISDIIVKQITACSPDTELDVVIKTMQENFIRHVPVIKDGNVCGLVSISDILRQLL